MNKELLKNTLVEIQQNIVKELEENKVSKHSLVDLDEGDTIDPEDTARQYEFGEMEQMIKVQLNKAQRNLEKLETIDFGPKSTVTSGAFVETDKFNFFIGFSTIPFDCDGVHVVGISQESPIYPIMANKKAGDKFSFCGNNYTIQNII